MNVARFQLEDLRSRAEGDWHEFLDLPTLSAGVYRVAAGDDDRARHQPHDRDEVYVALEGRGALMADGGRLEVTPGTVLFVKAGVEHFFHEVTEDLRLLVVVQGQARRGTAGSLPKAPNSQRS